MTNMTSDWRALAVIATISAVTIVLRIAPFALLRRGAGDGYLRYLRDAMPPGVMLLLVAYTLRDLDPTRYPYGLPELIALALSLGLYWRTGRALLSIGVGLGCHLLFVNGVGFG